MNQENQHANKAKSHWQTPQITKLSISRDTEQFPQDPPNPGEQS